MLITPVTDRFYQISNAFSMSLLIELIREFGHSSNWDRLVDTDPESHVRLQNNLHIDSDLSRKINKELEPAVEFIQQLTGRKLYQNSPQLWEDPIGYMNSIHCDTSPNLSVNIQVYLSDSVENIGTHCFKDDTWYSVPYRLNHGYIMIDPTELMHGMKHPVVDQRRSLYQSYRDFLEQSPQW